jgi:hypothetical protein
MEVNRMESLVKAIKRTDVQIVALAVIAGAQVSGVLTSLIFNVAQVFRMLAVESTFVGFRTGLAVKGFIVTLLVQLVLGLAVAVAAVWCLARVLARMEGEAGGTTERASRSD